MVAKKTHSVQMNGFQLATFSFGSAAYLQPATNSPTRSMARSAGPPLAACAGWHGERTAWRLEHHEG